MEEPLGIVLPKGVTIYPIVKYGAEVLERPASNITKFDDELRQLCADMFISMYAAIGRGTGGSANWFGHSAFRD